MSYLEKELNKEKNLLLKQANDIEKSKNAGKKYYKVERILDKVIAINIKLNELNGNKAEN